MTYKSFAFIGLGTVGSAILAKFIQEQERQGLKLRVLTRDSNTKSKPYKGKNVKFIDVDYSLVESIEQALHGTDVVLSTLRDGGLDEQKKVIQVAKKAGVKLFVPSEFGVNSQSVQEEYLRPKKEAQELLKENDLPYALFFIGFFPEIIVKAGPQLGLDFEKGEFKLFGDGNVPLSWTSISSVATYVHHVLTTLPPPKLENKIFNIQGDTKTWREIIQIWEGKHPTRTARVHAMKEDEIREFQAKQDNPFPIFMSNVFRDEKAGLNGGEANELWPEWKPKQWEDILGES